MSANPRIVAIATMAAILDAGDRTVAERPRRPVAWYADRARALYDAVEHGEPAPRTPEGE